MKTIFSYFPIPSFVIFFCFLNTLNSQVLVADINQSNTGSQPISMGNNGSQLAFFANGDEGRGLYALNKGETEPELIYNLSQTDFGSTIWASSLIDEHMYFVVNKPDSVFYIQSDLVTKQATIFARLGVGSLSSNSSGKFTKWGDNIYFVHRDAQTYRFQIWKLDLTTLESSIVTQLPLNGFPQNLLLFKDALYFLMDGDNHKGEIWKFDGINATQLIDTDPTNSPMNYGIFDLMTFQENLFFTSFSPEFGYEIWKSDGTTDGTSLLNDFVAGPESGSRQLHVIENQLFFTAKDSLTGWELYVSDGTLEGTRLFVDAEPGPSNGVGSRYFGKNGLIYFTKYNNQTGRELWRTDGTNAGTFALNEIYEGNESGILQFSQFSFLGDQLIFTADNGKSGLELWRTDGTNAGTELFLDLYSGIDDSDIRSMQLFDNQLYFSGEDAIYGNELWRSDGTAAGTQLVIDLNTNQSASSFPNRFKEVNGTLYFQARTGCTGNELFKTNGTTSSTGILKDIYKGKESNYVFDLAGLGDQFLFSAEDSENGRGLWVSDGTEEGTMLLQDTAKTINFGAMSAPAILKDRAIVKGFIIGAGQALVSSDGSSQGTEIVKVFNPYSGANGFSDDFVNLGDSILLFVETDTLLGSELWRTDGTKEGTTVVKDIRLTQDNYSHISRLINFGGIAYFKADDEYTGERVWRSDGTSEGTYPISRQGLEVSKDITGLNGDIYFIGYDIFSRQNFLAKVSIENQITEKISFSDVGYNVKYLRTLIPLKGQLFFIGIAGDGREELLKYDPTSNRAEIVKDINPGSEGIVRELTRTDSLLAFSSDDGVHGMEFWLSDGTNEGTFMVADMYPGETGASPSSYYSYKDFIYFRADAGNSLGAELYKYSPFDMDNDGYLPPEDVDDTNPLVNVSGDQGDINPSDWCPHEENVNACGLPNAVTSYLGGSKSTIEWEVVPNAIAYRLQIRFKGMDRWLVTATVKHSKVFIYAPMNRDYEYRIQTICADGESEYTEMLEWSTKEENILLVAKTRNADNFKPDIILEEVVPSTFEAFPNPVNDRLQIAYSAQLEEAQLQIHHLSGKTVWSQSLAPTQNYHQIDMQSLPEGIYLVTIKEKGKRIQTLRVIKGSNR